MAVPKNKKKQEPNAATPQTTTAMNTKTRGFYVTFMSHLYFQHAYYLLAMHFWIMTQKYGSPHALAY